MKDFNFFEERSLQELEQIKQHYLLAAVVAALILVCGSFFVRNLIVEAGLKKSINLSESFLNKADTRNKLKEYNELLKKRDILTKYESAVTSLDANLSSMDIVGSSILNQITAAVPKNVYFKSMTLDSKNLDINGTSDDRASIAEFLHNLKGLDFIQDANVGNISNGQNGQLTFSLKCAIKDEVKGEVH